MTIATALDINIDSVTATMQPTVVQQPVEEPRKHEPSPFEQRAIPMIERGIPVIPLDPATKVAFQSNWTERASTDSKKITEWGEQYPEAQRRLRGEG